MSDLPNSTKFLFPDARIPRVLTFTFRFSIGHDTGIGSISNSITNQNEGFFSRIVYYVRPRNSLLNNRRSGDIAPISEKKGAQIFLFPRFQVRRHAGVAIGRGAVEQTVLVQPIDRERTSA